jgi:uncharacterized membrane protein YdjX (TVP38/TMEM64 family)
MAGGGGRGTLATPRFVKRAGLATGGRRLFARHRWVIIGVGIAAAAVAYCVWLVLSDAPAYRFLVRLYVDRYFLKQTLRQWGILAPVIFIALQALQVIIAPIPGEVTGILGGYLFGEWLGLIYSTVGLTVGSVAAFGVGRWLGAHYVRALVSQETWDKMGFIVEAEGSILCFIIYLIPGLPKDMVCYLFGMSPMPLWVFALVSSLGRAPGTWVLSAQGAHTAAGDYLRVILLTAVVVAVALPLYYYRIRILRRFQGRARAEERGEAVREDRGRYRGAA